MVIIAPTNKAVEEINNKMMTSFRGIEKKYKSCDTVNDERLYPVEFLNKLTPSGFPKHIINIKVGSPIIIIWNIDPQNGHCNGTRYIVNPLHQHIIEAKIATGSKAGRTIFIPKITHATQENEYPFEMRRKQFPIEPAFAVTANKSQGQTFDRIGVYLPNNFFSHGQLYVAISRIGSKDNLKIMAPISNYNETEETFIDNCVYQEIL